MTSVGQVSAELTADSSKWEAATAAAAAALGALDEEALALSASLGDTQEASDALGDSLKTAEERAGGAGRGLKDLAPSVQAVVDRVEDLRSRQLALADALARADTALAGDKVKIEAVRKELEVATAALQRFGAAASKDLAPVSHASTQVQQSFAATTAAATAKSNSMRTLASQVGASATAVSGLNSVLGNNITQTNATIGAAGNLATMFASGGALGVAVTALTLAVGLLTEGFDKMGAKAKEAAEKARNEMKTLAEEIQGLKDELRAMADGTTAAIVRQEQIVEDAAVAVAELDAAFVRTYGTENLARAQRLIDANVALYGELAEMVEAYKELEGASDRYSQEAMKLLLLVEKHEMSMQKPVEEATVAVTKLSAAVASVPKIELISQQELDSLARLVGFGAGDGGTISIHETASQSELDDLARLVGFGPEEQFVVIDEAGHRLRLAAEAFGASVEANRKTTFDWAQVSDRLALALMGAAHQFGELFSAENLAGWIGAVASGQVGQAGGAAVGGTVGSAIDVALGGDGSIGGVIGSILGSILGTALDDLVDALGVLSPLFNAVGVVIRALSPILVVIRSLFESIGDVIEVGLAPVILALARPIASLLLIFVRLIQAVLPFVGMLLAAVASLVSFLDVLTVGVMLLDNNFFLPLAHGATFLYNALADFVNGIVAWGRQFLGDDFGVTMSRMAGPEWRSPIADFAQSTEDLRAMFEENTRAVDGNTDALNEFGREYTNVPVGYRADLAVFNSTPAGGGRGGGAVAGGIALNGPITFVMQTGSIADQVRRHLQIRRGFPFGGAPGSNRDESN